MSAEQTQGPYWFDVDSIRDDVRDGRPGARLDLALRVQDLSRCKSGGAAAPVKNAVVEIWHCDAGGAYSGFESGRRRARPRGGGGETSDGSYSAGDQEASPDRRRHLPARRPADRRRRHREVHDDLPRLVLGPHGAHPRKGARRQEDGPDVAALLRREGQRAVYERTPYSERSGRDVFNDGDGIYDESGTGGRRGERRGLSRRHQPRRRRLDPQLVDRALLGRLVVAPADELRPVADAVAGHVVEVDLADELGPQAVPLQLLVGLPATRLAGCPSRGSGRARGR